MITFRQYLTEESDKKISESDFIEGVLRDCGPFLEDFLIRKKFKPLYRGMNEHADFIKSNVRTNRVPKDLPPHVSRVVDALFKKSIDVKARSAALFVTSTYDAAAEYGQPFIIFPAGNFDTIFSEYANDLYTDWLGGNADKFILNYYKYFARSGPNDKFIEALKKYGLYTEDDANWEDPFSSWAEFGTFRQAFYALFNRHSRLKNIDTERIPGESELKKRLLQFLINDWWPKMDYHAGDLESGIREGNELMLTCKSYYGIIWSADEDVDSQYQSVMRKIKERL